MKTPRNAKRVLFREGLMNFDAIHFVPPGYLGALERGAGARLRACDRAGAHENRA